MPLERSSATSMTHPVSKFLPRAVVLLFAAVAVSGLIAACSGGGSDLPLKLVYQVDPVEATADNMTATQKIMESRLSLLSVPKFNVSVKGQTITVTLPAKTDLAKAHALIGTPGLLEFKQCVDPNQLNPPLCPRWVPTLAKDDAGNQVTLTSRYIRNAVVEPGPEGTGMEIAATLTAEGGNLLTQISQQLLGRALGLSLDGTVFWMPSVDRVLSTRFAIHGLPDAQLNILALQLKSGPLPVTPHFQGQQSSPLP